MNGIRVQVPGMEEEKWDQKMRKIRSTHGAAYRNIVLEINTPTLSYLYAPTSLSVKPTI
jgi:hypothetical protein